MSPAGAAEPVLAELDPFDLPEWLGVAEVTWSGAGRIAGHLVTGDLTGPDGRHLACDLLAVDQAYPAPVADEATRRRVHQAWQHGQVVVLRHRDRTTLATPGTAYPLATVLETMTRLARAVGADPARWSVRLALGAS